MPSGPPELHEKFCAMDADGCGDLAAQVFLHERGYRLTEGWGWSLPSPDHVPTASEIEAVNYLCWEWDFSGIERGGGE